MIFTRKQKTNIIIFNLSHVKKIKKSHKMIILQTNNFIFDIELFPVRYTNSKNKIPKIHLLRYKHIY